MKRTIFLFLMTLVVGSSFSFSSFNMSNRIPNTNYGVNLCLGHGNNIDNPNYQ